ncbi:MAG: hypothetical protein ABSE73_05330 [Planctomycetota bacterium]
MKTMFWGLSAGLLVASAVLAAEEFKTDDEGFIRDWLVLAPIPLEAENNGAEEIDKQQLKDEGKIQPKAGDKATANKKELAWKQIKAKDYYFDYAIILGQITEQSIGYSVAYLVADEEMKGLTLQMGSNDQGKVYLNGKELVKFTETRTVDKDQDQAQNVTLNKGVNTLVFKVINELNNWQGCIRFTDKAKAPVKNIKIRLEP